MSKCLTDLLVNSGEGSPITCTLSPESVQVIFFALSFITNIPAWQEDYFDPVSDAEWEEICDLIEGVTKDILP